MEMEIYGKITAANKTHLYWCANKAMDNGIVDKAWIIQNQHGPCIVIVFTYIKEIKINEGIIISVLVLFPVLSHLSQRIWNKHLLERSMLILNYPSFINNPIIHCFVYKNKVLAYSNVNPKATIQLTVGSFGNQYLTEFSSKPGGPWSANVISAMEMEIYGKITAANKTHLYWCANKAMDNGIVDKAWIIQK
jgi:hypothetical protein